MVTCEHRTRELTTSFEVNSQIINCNGDNACGNAMFMAGVCLKLGSTGDAAVMEAPFVSWNHIMKQGFWCMPCCILDENAHSKMKTCSAMSYAEDIRNQYNRHGRCGVEFNP